MFFVWKVERHLLAAELHSYNFFFVLRRTNRTETSEMLQKKEVSLMEDARKLNSLF